MLARSLQYKSKVIALSRSFARKNAPRFAPKAEQLPSKKLNVIQTDNVYLKMMSKYAVLNSDGMFDSNLTQSRLKELQNENTADGKELRMFINQITSQSNSKSKQSNSKNLSNETKNVEYSDNEDENNSSLNPELFQYNKVEEDMQEEGMQEIEKLQAKLTKRMEKFLILKKNGEVDDEKTKLYLDNLMNSDSLKGIEYRKLVVELKDFENMINESGYDVEENEAGEEEEGFGDQDEDINAIQSEMVAYEVKDKKGNVDPVKSMEYLEAQALKDPKAKSLLNRIKEIVGNNNNYDDNDETCDDVDDDEEEEDEEKKGDDVKGFEVTRNQAFESDEDSNSSFEENESENEDDEDTKISSNKNQRGEFLRKAESDDEFYSDFSDEEKLSNTVTPDPEGFDIHDDPGEKIAKLRDAFPETRKRWKAPATLPNLLSRRVRKLLDKRNMKAVRDDHIELVTAQSLREPKMNSVKSRPQWATENDGPALKEIPYGPKQTLAYAAWQLAPAYGVADSIFHDVDIKMGDSWKPKTVLDFGSGPGTALWAARERWGTSLSQYVAVEPSKSMTEAGHALLSEFPGLTWRRSLRELLPTNNKGEPVRPDHSYQKDLVLAFQVLSELPTDSARRTATSVLWDLTKEGGILVVAEKGTPWGFHTIGNARELVLNLANSSTEPPEPIIYGKLGLEPDYEGKLPPPPKPYSGTACVIAPCSHSFKCPLHKFGPRGKMRCTFLQQPPPSPLGWVRERFPKGRLGFVGYEHSYIAIKKVKKDFHEKNDADWPDARILMTPLTKKSHVIVDVCNSEGQIVRHSVSKSRLDGVPGGYRALRKSTWGGLIPNFFLKSKKLTPGLYNVKEKDIELEA